MNEKSFINRNKTEIWVIFGTGVIVTLIVVASNFNIEVKVNRNGNGGSSTNGQSAQMAQGGVRGDSMASHHGESVQVDSTLFDGLIGKIAPDFTLESYGGSKVTLSSLKGKSVILFFNEGLMCYPSCWNQIVAFGTDAELGKKAVILNITVDPKNNWTQAVNKMPELAKATTLFDSDRKVSTTYGVLTLPSSMHKGQFPGHTYVVIDKEGFVKYVKDDVRMAVRNQELSVEIDKL